MSSFRTAGRHKPKNTKAVNLYWLAAYDWEAYTGAACAKRWSAWTLYHDLLRWRQKRYDIAAIQSKGVEYAPWVNRVSPFYVELLKLAQKTGLEFPHETKASIHKRVHKRLATVSLSQQEASQ